MGFELGALRLVATVCFSLLFTQSAPAQLPAAELFLAPWLWMYFPVKIELRDGQQIGVVTNAFVKRVPLSMTILFSFFIGVSPPSAMSWSSVSRKMMFGLVTLELTGEGTASTVANITVAKKASGNIAAKRFTRIHSTV